MLCYECSKAGRTHHAVGLCHHCSAALCPDHASMIDDPVIMTYPVAATDVLPKHARLLLCGVCLAAYRQQHETGAAAG